MGMGLRPRARTTDPEESHEAAASVSQPQILRERVLTLLREFGPLADHDIVGTYTMHAHQGRWPHASPSGIRSRRDELVKLGQVAQDGEGRTPSGRRCAMWGVVGEPMRLFVGHDV